MAVAPQRGAQRPSWAEEQWSPHYPFTIWHLDPCPGVEDCISTGAGDPTEAPAGGRKKGYGTAVAVQNDCREDHSSSTFEKNKFSSVHLDHSRLQS